MQTIVINNSSKSLSQVLKELDDYNREHHTFISYGQYVSMMDKETNKGSGEGTSWTKEQQR